MRCSFLRVDKLPSRYFDWSFQHSQDFSEQMFISNSQRPHLPYQFRMINVVEKAFYVKFDNVMQMAFLKSVICICDCIFDRTVWSESVAVFAKMRFTDWFQDLLETLLNQSVPYARNSEWARFSVGLRNFSSSYRFGTLTSFCA